MSLSPLTVTRTIEVDQDFLPDPAAKLVITQHLAYESQSNSPFWAWLIVAAFYDRHGAALWSTEIFWAHLDIELESDTEGESDEEEASEGYGEEEPSDAEADGRSSTGQSHPSPIH